MEIEQQPVMGLHIVAQLGETFVRLRLSIGKAECPRPDGIHKEGRLVALKIRQVARPVVGVALS